MKADDILTTARRELVDFIIFEVKALHGLISTANAEEEGGYAISVNDDLDCVIKVNRWVSDYEGNDYEEPNSISKIVVETPEDHLYFTIHTFDREYEPEMDWFELSTDKLCEVANTLEKSYKKALKK